MNRVALLLVPLVACIGPKPPVNPVVGGPVAIIGVSTPPTVETPATAVQILEDNFARVQFELDSATLTTDAKIALAANATILLRHPTIVVEVQGHTDERGTTEYNLALGDRRAESIVAYLAAVGVPRRRLTVVSFGEERPLASGASESVWAENRRAEFRVLATDGRVRGTVGG